MVYIFMILRLLQRLVKISPKVSDCFNFFSSCMITRTFYSSSSLLFLWLHVSVRTWCVKLCVIFLGVP